MGATCMGITWIYSDSAAPHTQRGFQCIDDARAFYIGEDEAILNDFERTIFQRLHARIALLLEQTTYFDFSEILGDDDREGDGESRLRLSRFGNTLGNVLIDGIRSVATHVLTAIATIQLRAAGKE